MGQEATRLDDERARLTASQSQPQGGELPDDPEAIEREIEHTRMEMSGTIDEIQERLNPDVLKEQAKEAAENVAEHAKEVAYDQTIGRVVDAKDQAVEKVQEFAGQAADKVRGLTGGGDSGDIDTQSTSTMSQYTSTARDKGNDVLETIRTNPVPAAVAGAGLGWFLTSRSSQTHDKGRKGYMRNTPSSSGSSYRGGQMDTNSRTGYSNWDRQQPEPGHLREYEGNSFMSQVSNTGSDVVGIVQRNPIPAALAGVGLGWFLMRRSSGGSDHGDQPYYYRPSQHTTFQGGSDYRGGQGSYQQGYGSQGYSSQGYGSQGYGAQGNYQQGSQRSGQQGQQGSDDDSSRMSQMSGQAQERAGDALHRAQDVGQQAFGQVSEYGSQAMGQVSEYGSQAMEHVTNLPHQAQDQFQNLRGTYQQKMQESPVMMGVVAMGLGLAVGMLLPETQKENQVFGEKREQLMDRAQEMAGEAVEHVQETAKEAVHAAQEAVQESTQSQGQNSSSSQSSASTS